MKERFFSYTLEFEDLILYQALHGIENGFYVDIGANDPVEASVTKAFYEKGWSGINIEPLKDKFEALCLDRSRDINLNIGIADKSGQLEFYVNGGLSTCDKKTIERMGDKGGIAKTVLEVLPLSDVLEKHLPPNQEIHFLKIDIEGFEEAALKGMDFSKNRPYTICLESCVPETHIACHKNWEYLLLNNKYELLYAHSCNRYYVDTACSLYETIKNNLSGENPFGEYEIFSRTSFARLKVLSTPQKIKKWGTYFFRFAKFYLPFGRGGGWSGEKG